MYTVNLSQNTSALPYISATVLEAIEDNIAEWKKTILYLNKRGQFSSLICKKCQHLYKCDNCDLSLSIHKYPAKMICHTCAFQADIPEKCSQCGSSELEKVGIGTQQIEESMQNYFTDKNIFRFDTDSVANKSEKQLVLERIEAADIIIGTKMITTGFNIPNLGIIAVILLEQELSMPQFDIEERLYANMKQLIGRWNRNGQHTDIYIQTFIPENPVIEMLTTSNYKDFLIHTLWERKLFNYPPFCELITIEYRDLDKNKALSQIEKIFAKLDKHNHETKHQIYLIPTPYRRHNQYHYKIILKGNELRDFLKCIKSDLFRLRNLRIVFE